MAAQSVESVGVAHHAAARWDERTSPASVAPETAWRRAWQMPLIREYRNVDELRYFAPEQVVLIREHGTLVTAIDVATADSQQGRALREAVERQFGPLHEANTDLQENQNE